MRRWPLAAVMAGAAYTAQSARPTLEASVVTYGWHSAPMAPVYRSLYVVRVEPGGAGTLMYEFGPSGSGQKTTRKFQVSATDDARLLDALTQAKVLDGAWAASADKPLGAAQERVEIAVPAGKSVTIDSALEPEAAGRFRSVVEAIRAAVPKELWVEMDAAQKAYVAGHQAK
jgi:hypothetical protein